MESSPETSRLEERCRRLESQISTIKQISSLRKNLLELREKQAKNLISKLKHYEVIVTEEREYRHSLSSRLQSAELQCGQLKERLTQNVHTIEEMKTNYENKVSTLINELQTSEQRNKQLSEQLSKGCSIEELVKRLDEKDKLMADTQRQMKRVCERNKMLSYQMSLLNNLFNETEGVTIDFEKIKAIGDIVRESQSIAEESDDVLSDDPDSEVRQSVDLENLLDSMEKSEDVIPAEIPGEESCYKSVDTKKGPQLVLSVSRTFIKLKDLIVEKKSLQKEIDTLKQLNTKLESKVDKQEHRLYRVTMELNKTWSLVSKLKQQHKRLYNSEAVLRYELQEKRVLLEKLKNELSVSRDKWRRVRQKNSQSQIEWEKLRDEFAQRKHQSSQESGTFSEVMSLSSGENDVTVEEDDVDDEVTLDINSDSGRRGSKPVRSRNPSNSSNIQTEETVSDRQPDDSEHDDGCREEEDLGEGARALSPLDDENFDDPLEDLVSNLVEDIENEADTEDDGNNSTSTAPVENDSSPSPDFEDRMRRRANRLQMLEEQCVILHQKLQASTVRSEVLSTKLAVLHEHYGPSDSSTGTPSDEHHQQQPETASNVHKAETNLPASTVVTDEETTSISTDAAYVSGTENNGNSGMDDEVKPEFDTQVLALVPAKSTENATNTDSSSANCSPLCQESSTSRAVELISASENSPAVERTIQCSDVPNPNSSNNNDNELQHQQLSQGQSEDNGDSEEARFSDGVTIELTSAVVVRDVNTEYDQFNENQTTSIVIHEDCITPPHDQPTTSSGPPQDNVQSDDNVNDANPLNRESNPVEQSFQPSSVVESEPDDDTTRHIIEADLSQQQQQLRAAEREDVAAEEPLPQVEEPLPMIQETVVQHFPTTSEEEANEFAPVQIRPEFLRILQEADEATNANSLDWMPSLLTITHSVALLRLDPELPSSTSSSGGRTHSVGANHRTITTNRSLSESLRIEIPRQSPSPPMHPPLRQNDNVRIRMNNTDELVSAEDEGGGEDSERSINLRKDPSFLSRMIIKQLPKRLQLLKNENHTLQMEAAEANMRMKELKRQLTKELDKQQQLSISLDAQIEDKNLIEFELREEIEKKEKVIEELQMEIDESKEYIDELRKEKDEADVFFKALLEEKLDMEEPQVSPQSVTNCHNCKRPFSFLTRRKCHCKICGKVYCKDCAIPRDSNKRTHKRPRLCTSCYLRRQRLVALVNATKRKESALDK